MPASVTFRVFGADTALYTFEKLETPDSTWIGKLRAAGINRVNRKALREKHLNDF